MIICNNCQVQSGLCGCLVPVPLFQSSTPGFFSRTQYHASVDAWALNLKLSTLLQFNLFESLRLVSLFFACEGSAEHVLAPFVYISPISCSIVLLYMVFDLVLSKIEKKRIPVFFTFEYLTCNMYYCGY